MSPCRNGWVCFCADEVNIGFLVTVNSLLDIDILVTVTAAYIYRCSGKNLEILLLHYYTVVTTHLFWLLHRTQNTSLLNVHHSNVLPPVWIQFFGITACLYINKIMQTKTFAALINWRYLLLYEAEAYEAFSPRKFNPSAGLLTVTLSSNGQFTPQDFFN